MTEDQLEALKAWVNAAIDLKIAEAKEDGYTFSASDMEYRMSIHLKEVFLLP
jgi:hypothetical protein